MKNDMTKKGVLQQLTSTYTETFWVKCLALKRLKSAFSRQSFPGTKQYIDRPEPSSTNRHWQIFKTQLISFFVTQATARGAMFVTKLQV